MLQQIHKIKSFEFITNCDIMSSHSAINFDFSIIALMKNILHVNGFILHDSNNIKNITVCSLFIIS